MKATAESPQTGGPGGFEGRGTGCSLCRRGKEKWDGGLDPIQAHFLPASDGPAGTGELRKCHFKGREGHARHPQWHRPVRPVQGIMGRPSLSDVILLLVIRRYRVVRETDIGVPLLV